MTDAVMLDRCPWCQGDVWSDNDHYQAHGYTFHRSCAAELTDVLRDFETSSASQGDE